MSRFNTASEGTKTINKAGGEAYSQSPELELVSLLLTSFAGEQFYRSSNETFERLRNLITSVDKKFAAQAAIYARTEIGMRSITHVLASELARHISGLPWAKSFYEKIVYRPDDMSEIIAYHLSQKQKIPNSIKKGFAAAFDKFNAYQLAKYRGEGKSVKLVDVANIVHPMPTEGNKEALQQLMNGTLKSTDTWESMLTQAGQKAENEEGKAELKKEVWEKLINERKIGYFALLRNLRNIIEQSPDMITKACELLTDENLIGKSLVLPFRFVTAYDEIVKLPGSRHIKEVMQAINKAVDISLKNVPKFDGETLVVLDVSGSMSGKPAQIGSLFTAILVKANNADSIVFSDSAKYVNVNTADSTLTLAATFRFSQGGTNFHSIFQAANRRYDRIIILSDMQGWIGGYCPAVSFGQYKSATGADPFIYSFDLNSYGSMQFPERKVFALAGFSDKIFDVMKLLETDKAALINRVKEVKL